MTPGCRGRPDTWCPEDPGQLCLPSVTVPTQAPWGEGPVGADVGTWVRDFGCHTDLLVVCTVKEETKLQPC